MPGEILVFDAAGSNPDGTDPGTALNIGPAPSTGCALRVPGPRRVVTWAGSMDTEGALPASTQAREPHDQPTIMCATAAALRHASRRKIGKLFREGGTLRRSCPNGEVITSRSCYGARVKFPPTSRGTTSTRAHCGRDDHARCQPYGLGPSHR
jgi:hypothetical protein